MKYFDFLLKVNLSNHQIVQNKDQRYKAYIGKGNNFGIFRTLFQKRYIYNVRWWWSVVDEVENAQCIIT